jgi:V/A-type H+/Na+-transporting ATPase subunit C
MIRKLRLGLYPYTYARVSVMKGELLSKQDWQNLLKMGPNEILRFLQDSCYKQEIDELSDKRNIEDFEMALNRNVMRTMLKLKKISDDKVQEVLRVYLQRYDIENFKTILRGKFAGIPEQDIQPLISPSINHSEEYYSNMLRKEIKDIILAFPLTVQEDDLFQIENELDRWYYTQLLTLSERLAGQGGIMKKFIQSEIDVTNIKIIFRLTREGIDKQQIREYLIFPRKEIQALTKLSDVKTLAEALFRMHLISFKVDDKMHDSDIFTRLEIDLDTNLLVRETKLMHKYPLTVNVILGFMFAKEYEIKNLKILLKGKQLGLGDAIMNELLVAI